MEQKPKRIKTVLIGGYNKLSTKRNIEKLEEKYQEMLEEECSKYEEQLEEKTKELDKLLKRK